MCIGIEKHFLPPLFSHDIGAKGHQCFAVMQNSAQVAWEHLRHKKQTSSTKK
jgi:hypothetical protein